MEYAKKSSSPFSGVFSAAPFYRASAVCVHVECYANRACLFYCTSEDGEEEEESPSFWKSIGSERKLLAM